MVFSFLLSNGLAKDELVKRLQRSFNVIPDKAGHEVKLLRYPVISNSYGCLLSQA
jgi:hypothetical protein